MELSAYDSGWLRRRLLLVTGGLMLLFTAAGTYVVHELALLSRRLAERQLLETTRALTLVVDSQYERYAMMLHGLAASIADGRPDWARLDRIARAMTAGPDEWIVISDRTGRQLVNTRLPPGAALPNAGWQPATLTRLDGGRPFACPLSRGLAVPRLLCFNQPVMRDGRAALILSVLFRPERLQRIIDQQRVPDSRRATIVDATGTVVWRNVDPDRYVGKPATSDMVRAIANQPEGVRESVSLEGAPTVIAHARGRYGLSFLVAVPRDQIGRGGAVSARSGLLASGLLIGLALVIALLFGKRLSDAIGRLALATSALRDRRAPAFQPTGIPEIDVVGRALDEAHQLRLESDERFELAQEVGGVGAWDWNVREDRGTVTKGYLKVHGLPPQDEPLRLAQVIDVLNPADRTRYLAELHASMKATAPVAGEYRVRHPDGSTHCIAFKGRLIRDEQGRAVRAVGLVRDVTAERAVEAALAASEERLRLATDGTGMGIYDLDLGTGCGRWTEQAFHVLGLAPPADGVGRFEQWRELLHPDDRERVLAAHDDAAASVGVWRIEYRVIRHDTGETRWLEAYGRFIPQRNGALRSVGVVADVTERKRIELSLAESESRLRRSQEAGGIGSYEWDMATGRGSQSDGMLRMVGLPPGKSYSLKEIIEPVLKEDKPRVMATIEAIQRGERRRETNYRIRHPQDGRVRWIRDVGQLEHDAQGRPARWVGIIQDVTDKAAAEAALRHLNETLEAQVEERTEQLRQSQKLEGMGQLTGGVAHDFNNLLTPIIGSLDLLQRRGIGSDREQRLLEGALQSAERAKILVQRLLSFARRQPLQAVPVDLAELVGGMADLIGSTSGPKVKLVVDLEPRLPSVKADPNQIEMALLNLSVNARDAMPSGGQLTIAAAGTMVEPGHRSGLPPGRYVRLAVSDTGIGMDADTLARAIEPFFSTKGVGQGTGLGLSMVHGLAAQLGGALTIDSKPGLGTTVELWLPLARERASRTTVPHEPSAAPLAQTVLLVDDDRLARISTAEMLADIGYAVVEAESGEEAWRLIEGGLDFDLLVSDHLMPGMNGTDLARRLRTRDQAKPVLIVSGYAEVEGIAPDLPRLVKPFRRAELAAALTRSSTDAPAPRPQPSATPESET